MTGVTDICFDSSRGRLRLRFRRWVAVDGVSIAMRMAAKAYVPVKATVVSSTVTVTVRQVKEVSGLCTMSCQNDLQPVMGFHRLLCFLTTILLLTLCCYGEDLKSTNDNNNVEERPPRRELGQPSLESSWPTQQLDLSLLRDEQKVAYTRFMEGCATKFGKQHCDKKEAERIRRNARQPGLQKNFTETGYTKMQVPESLMRTLRNHYQSTASVRDDWSTGSVSLNHWEASSVHVPLDERAIRLLGTTMQSVLETWCGTKLVPTSVQGIRVFTRGSVVAPHVLR